jgi:hypothetical protein
MTAKPRDRPTASTPSPKVSAPSPQASKHQDLGERCGCSGCVHLCELRDRRKG